MNERRGNGESQFIPKEEVSVEKFQEAKLDRLDPHNLIPVELESMPEIVGKTDIAVFRTKGSIEYVITDEKKVTLNQIEQDFEYFDEDNLEKYPQLNQSKNRFNRPLIHGSISELSLEILFNGMFETNATFHGKGIGVIFQENIARLAKQLGYKFLTGYQNDAEAARFFFKRGRYLLEEIKDELQQEFANLKRQDNDETVFFTIKFLNSEDISKYIKPERIDSSVEDKIEFKEKIIALNRVFENLSELLEKIKEKKEALGDRATVVEILEDLNSILLQEEQYNGVELSEDDDNSMSMVLEYLKSKSSAIVQDVTLEELEESEESIV